MKAEKNFYKQVSKALLVNLREKSYRKLIRLFGICPLWEDIVPIYLRKITLKFLKVFYPIPIKSINHQLGSCSCLGNIRLHCLHLTMTCNLCNQVEGCTSLSGKSDKCSTGCMATQITLGSFGYYLFIQAILIPNPLSLQFS